MLKRRATAVQPGADFVLFDVAHISSARFVVASAMS